MRTALLAAFAACCVAAIAVFAGLGRSAPPCWSQSPHKVCPPPTTTDTTPTSTSTPSTTGTATSQTTTTQETTTSQPTTTSTTTTSTTATTTASSYTVSQSITDGSTLTGGIHWLATPSDVGATKQVDFYIDGAFSHTEFSSPYGNPCDACTYDTTQLANGSHTFKAVATSTSGQTASVSATATVSNQTTQGTVTWRGDYETGDFSQWTGTQYIAGNGTGVYTSPVRQGKYAAKFVVNAGDDPINSSGERAEVYIDQAHTDGYQGQEVWYAWSTMFATGTALYSGTWNLFSQWHDTSNTDPCSPPMRIGVDSATHDVIVWAWGGNTDYNVCSNQYRKQWDLGPISFGAWHDFIVHVRWAADMTGFVEVYLDGRKAVPLTFTGTLYTGAGMYWKQGLYRGPISSGSSVVYQDGAVVAGDYAGAVSAFPAGSWPTSAPS